VGQDRLAVIDLGSNTFHLLIVQRHSAYPGFSIIFRKREYVYLSKGGLKIIDNEAFVRGLECLARFSSQIKKYKVNHISCIGTAALRKADNSETFISRVRRSYGIDIKLIDGLREAELIYKGVGLTLAEKSDPVLTLDIGGGSVEFIVSIDNTLKASWSLEIGISVLRSKFHNLSREDVFDYLSQECSELIKSIRPFSPVTLAGASGPFVILEHMNGLSPNINGNIITSHSAIKLLTDISSSSLQKRKSMKGMPEQRADLSLESVYLMIFVLQSFLSIEKITISPYSLKEGVIVEHFNLD